MAHWQTWLAPLGAYPAWLVAACVAVLLAAGVWLLAKLVKWSLYALLLAAALAGGVLVVWAVFGR